MQLVTEVACNKHILQQESRAVARERRDATAALRFKVR